MCELRRWTVAVQPRGTELIRPRAGRTQRRYDHVAQRLHAAGWSAVAYDHRGHGLSPGPRGGLRDSTCRPRPTGRLHDGGSAVFAVMGLVWFVQRVV
jgi:pimeloyl-ACP methyl ester carboxylesterase